METHLMADASVALRKLQSGQPLSDAEKKVLGISVTVVTPTPAVTPVVTDTFMEDAIPLNVKGSTGGTSTDTSKITDAEVKAASVAAARELSMTPYTELSAAERAMMTQAEKTAYLKAAREEKMALDAEERAASDPMKNFQQRPSAPSDADGNFINYYSWVGGVNSGEWRLYRAPNTPENVAKYGSRSIGGETQATPQSAVGANALINQPQPIKDANGNITSWSIKNSDGTTTTTTVNPTVSTTTTTNPTVSTTTTTNPTVSTTATSTTGLDAQTTALIKSLQDQIAALTKQVTGTTTAAAEQKALDEKIRKENALASLTSTFTKYNLQSLIPKIKELVINGATESTIALELAETPEYKQRFKANQERLKKNLAVLDPGTYIGMEDSYRQALRAYGLKQFDTDDYVSQFIANDISANELSNRIVTAVQRVQNADPAITKQLRDFYNIGQNDLVAYVLDPNQQFQKIERQVQAAEIGVAAARQGITAGVQVAEQLAAQGVSQAEAQKGYATIADILPDATRLSDIYGTTLEGYDLGQAEQEVFNQLASAQRRRQKLTQREVAAFGGSSGTNRTSLTTSSVGQI
jgi:hypothetical protein